MYAKSGHIRELLNQGYNMINGYLIKHIEWVEMNNGSYGTYTKSKFFYAEYIKKGWDDFSDNHKNRVETVSITPLGPQMISKVT